MNARVLRSRPWAPRKALSASAVQAQTRVSPRLALEKLGLAASLLDKSKRPSHPTSVPLRKLLSSQFPLTVKELVDDYAFRHNPQKFQHDLLSTLPFFPEPDASGRVGKVLQTTLLCGNHINEFVVLPKPDLSDAEYASCNHLVMVHGYGAGLGFFLKNFAPLLARSNWVIHAIDLLGYGCSSRPDFSATNLEEVEAFFHDSLDEWFALRNLKQTPERNLVLAHSMGAYLLATYGIRKDPLFCSKLLMVSPGAVIKHRKPVSVPPYFAKLWEQNISPFLLVRKAGPLGSKLVSMWSSRRFANLPENEASLLHKYSYGIFQSKGSGEYMLNYLLAPGADARHPLVDRGIERLKCKILWCYGAEDWMDKAGGEICSKIVNGARGNGHSTVRIIPNAGHHLYLDNKDAFHRMVYAEMDELERSLKHSQAAGV